MDTKFIEATQGAQFNWGKFLLLRMTQEEFDHPSAIDVGRGLLRARMWNPCNVIVFDLETKEGAVFIPGGSATADLNKHKIWVCPMFEPFLHWLYQQDVSDFSKLPSMVTLDTTVADFAGYRRPGPEGEGSPMVRFADWIKDMGISKPTAWRWQKMERIKTVKIGGLVYITKEEIARFEAAAERGEFDPGRRPNQP